MVVQLVVATVASTALWMVEYLVVNSAAGLAVVKVVVLVAV